MLILDVMQTCSNATLSKILPVVKNIILLIQIIVPIALLISFTVEFVKLSINPEDKKGFRKLLNKLMAAFIIFAIPFLFNVIMGAVGESSEFSNCWVNASNSKNDGEYTYIEDDDREPTKVVNEPEDYNK